MKHGLLFRPSMSVSDKFYTGHIHVPNMAEICPNYLFILYHNKVGHGNGNIGHDYVFPLPGFLHLILLFIFFLPHPLYYRR